MKTLSTLFAIFFATTLFASEVTFDGCKAVKVEGANYYNFIDPTCKTISEQFSSSKGEDKRAEALEE